MKKKYIKLLLALLFVLGTMSMSAQPPNDNAPGAVLLTVGAGCTGNPYTNLNATQSVGEPFPACIGIAGYHSVWFKFVAPASGSVKVSNDFIGGTMGDDTRMVLYDVTNVNDYTTFVPIACDDDNGTVSSVEFRSIFFAVGLTPASTYYIQVDGFDGTEATGTFCLTVDELAANCISTTTACNSGQNLININDEYTGWLSLVGEDGGLIAMVKNTDNLPSFVSDYFVNMNINAGPLRISGLTYYLDRNFRITTQSNNLDIKFFFKKTELDALMAADPTLNLNNLSSNSQLETVVGCHSDFNYPNGATFNVPQNSGSNGTSADGLVNWIEISSGNVDYNFYLSKFGAPLPISLKHFSGYKDGSSNQLRWTTATESNNRGFEVQRSTDGINYTAIGFVNSLANSGNSAKELNYTFTDNSVTGSRQYYRLRQADYNGNGRISNIVLIKTDKPITLIIDGLFPNPANNVVNLLVSTPDKDRVTVIITDIAGRAVAKEVVSIETGSNTIPVNITNLSKGTYIVKLVCSSNGNAVVSKFVKQ
jgi:hypothetical protein